MILDVQDLSFRYSKNAKPIFHNVNFQMEKGEILTILGANGAGKTTTLHTITGLKGATDGVIEYDGKDLRRMDPSHIIRIGMAHVPEGRHVFTQMSVQENLEMGSYIMNDRSQIKKNMDMVYEYFPRLLERKKQLAGTLSGGEQQMLATGRALMSNPRIVLMDEPSMGLSPIFVNEIFDIIQAVSESGTTVLLVEQNAKKALSIADRAYVLETGKITMSGNAKDLLEDEAVKKAYLGE